MPSIQKWFQYEIAPGVFAFAVNANMSFMPFAYRLEKPNWDSQYYESLN